MVRGMQASKQVAAQQQQVGRWRHKVSYRSVTLGDLIQNEDGGGLQFAEHAVDWAANSSTVTQSWSVEGLNLTCASAPTVSPPYSTHLPTATISRGPADQSLCLVLCPFPHLYLYMLLSPAVYVYCPPSLPASHSDNRQAGRDRCQRFSA